MNSRSLVLVIGLSALGHAGAQIGNAPASALSSQGNTVGRQVESAPPVNAAAAAQSPAAVVGTSNPGAAPKTGALTPAQMTKPTTPSPSARPPSTGALKIVEPAEGSTNLPSAVHLRVTYPREFAGQTAEVELSWQVYGAMAWNVPGIIDQGAKVWQMPIDQLGKGIVVPRDKTCNPTQTIDTNEAGQLFARTACNDSNPRHAMVKVRIAGAMPEIWNDTVHFVIEIPKERPATTPATKGNWSAAPPSPANAAGAQSIGAQNPRPLATQNPFNSSGGASTAQPPSSTLKPGP